MYFEADQSLKSLDYQSSDDLISLTHDWVSELEVLGGQQGFQAKETPGHRVLFSKT